MKYSKFAFLALTLIAGTTARAEYQIPWGEIQDLQNANKPERAFLLAAQAIERLHEDLRIGEFVAEIDSRIKVIRKEKVIQKNDSRFDLKVLFLSASGRSSTNITKILTQNPEEVAEFPARVRREVRALRGSVQDYVRLHAPELVELKHLGIKAMELVLLNKTNAGSAYDRWHPSADLLESTLAKVLDIQFLGEQTITTCVETTYARRTDRESVSASIDILFTNLASFGYESTKRWYRYTDTACSSSVNEIEVSGADVLKVDFTLLDDTLTRLGRVAYAQVIYGSEQTQFPTFGSPYYK